MPSVPGNLSFVKACVSILFTSILLMNCGGAGGHGGAGGDDETKFVDRERDECDGVPECVSVTTQQPLEWVHASGELVTLRCPDDRPYFWDWGYRSSGGLEFTLLSTLDQPGVEKHDGVVIEVTKTGADNIQPRYHVYCACSSVPMTGENRVTARHQAESKTSPEASVAYVEAERTPLQEMDLAVDAGKFSYVGTEIWEGLSSKEPGEPPSEQNPQDLPRFRGVTWNYSTTNRFLEDFILQTPRGAWGASSQELYFTADHACPDESRVCNAQFRLQECTDDDDCSLFSGTTCQPVDATVTGAGSPNPKSLCLRPQDVLWNELYKVMVTANKVVDITTLNQATQAPDGRFREAIRNAVTYLASSGREVTIRILIGHFTCNNTMPGDPRKLLDYILQDAKQMPNCNLQVQVGYYEANPLCTTSAPLDYLNALLYMSMNHSKIVCADGALALVGGQNLYDEDYLSRHPAHDVTLRVQGPAAYDAHAFATHLWGWVRDHMDRKEQVHAWTWKHGEDRYRTDAVSLVVQKLPLSDRNQDVGSSTVFGVGRLGQWYFQDSPVLTANASDLAIQAMFRASRHRIMISQQDVIWGPAAALEGKLWGLLDPPYRHSVVSTWYHAAYVDSLAEKLLDGVDVYVVFSNLWSRTGVKGAGAYYNGFEPEAVGDMFLWALSRKDRFQELPDSEQKEILCKRLHVATLRFGPDEHWGEKYSYNMNWLGFGNHAKTVIVDDQAFYVGSHNFYPMNLQEYGLIVDDRDLTEKYIREYWDNIWSWSRVSAVCGGEEGSPCMFE